MQNCMITLLYGYFVPNLEIIFLKLTGELRLILYGNLWFHAHPMQSLLSVKTHFTRSSHGEIGHHTIMK